MPPPRVPSITHTYTHTHTHTHTHTVAYSVTSLVCEKLGCKNFISDLLTHYFMTAGRYYLAHTHLSLCQKVLPLIPQYCWKIKLISLATNYHMYYMIKWYADTSFSVYQFTICSCTQGKVVYFGYVSLDITD